MLFDDNPDVQVDRDESGRVVQLRHTRQAFSLDDAGLEHATASEIAERYVREVAPSTASRSRRLRRSASRRMARPPLSRLG